MILNNSVTPGNGTLVTTNESQTIEYTNLRYVPKLGLAFASGNWSAGAAISFPSITIGGTGTIARDIAANNLQVNLQTNPNNPPILSRTSTFSNLALNARETGLTTTIQTPCRFLQVSPIKKASGCLPRLRNGLAAWRYTTL